MKDEEMKKTEEATTTDEENKKTEADDTIKKDSDTTDATVKNNTADKEEESKDKEEKTDNPLDLDIKTPYIDASVAKNKKKKKVVKIVAISLLAVIALVYIAGVIYFGKHFSTNTKVNGIDVSMMKTDEAYDKLIEDAESFSVDIEFYDEKHNISFADGAFSFELAEDILDVKNSQNKFLWFIDIFTEDKLTVDYVNTVDEVKLKDIISAYDCMQKENMKEAVNAKVFMEDGEVKVLEDRIGTILDIDEVVAFVKDKAASGEPLIKLMDNSFYQTAEITADSDKIAEDIKACEDYLNINAVYDFKGYKVQIPKEELSVMGYLSSDGKVKISKANVLSYAKKFAQQYSTCNTERKFKTHDGDLVLIYGGYYGWLLDGEAEGEELYEYMIKQKDFEKTPVCIREGYAYWELNDVGPNYIEIDLTDQHVYVFSNGEEVFDTPCVSGNVSWGMSTPGGIYPLTYKMKNAVLNGPGYSTPVAYWMPFNGGIGLHDATWKTKFGEDYYIYDGSHGCINLPLDAAAVIYEYVEQGSPIVCYWEDEVTYLKE